MTIDWAATGAMLQGEGTLLGAAAVFAAAAIGRTTFNSWRRQQVAGRKLSEAERILEATYKGRRALSYVRSPVLRHELNDAKDKLKDHPTWRRLADAKQRRVLEAQVYEDRIKVTEDEQKALDQCLPMARALFGIELEQAVESLAWQFREIQESFAAYIHDDGEDKAFSERVRRALSDTQPPDREANEVTEAIAKAVAIIETQCLPVLRG